jgi:hypothetical protein
MLDLNRLFESMTKEELDAYAREGTLPAWFPSGNSQAASQCASRAAQRVKQMLGFESNPSLDNA